MSLSAGTARKYFQRGGGQQDKQTNTLAACLRPACSVWCDFMRCTRIDRFQFQRRQAANDGLWSEQMRPSLHRGNIKMTFWKAKVTFFSPNDIYSVARETNSLTTLQVMHVQTDWCWWWVCWTYTAEFRTTYQKLTSDANRITDDEFGMSGLRILTEVDRSSAHGTKEMWSDECCMQTDYNVSTHGNAKPANSTTRKLLVPCVR